MTEFTSTSNTVGSVTIKISNTWPIRAVSYHGYHDSPELFSPSETKTNIYYYAPERTTLEHFPSKKLPVKKLCSEEINVLLDANAEAESAYNTYHKAGFLSKVFGKKKRLKEQYMKSAEKCDQARKALLNVENERKIKIDFTDVITTGKRPTLLPIKFETLQGAFDLARSGNNVTVECDPRTLETTVTSVPLSVMASKM